MTARTMAGTLVVLALLVAWPSAAHADAIDGEWCREGRSFKIEGPKIRTWNGTETTGDYSRHGFRYKTPPGEPEAGADIAMLLRNEETIEVSRPGAGRGLGAGEPEIWRRCRVTS